MNRAEFVAEGGESWWLWDPPSDSRFDEARRQLGAAFGFGDYEWYADPYRRNPLFDLLESQGSQLLYDLDYLNDDEAKLQWVQAVTQLAAPPPPAAPQVDAPAPADTPAPIDAPARSIFARTDSTSAPAATDAPAAAAPNVDEAVQTVLADVTGGGLAGLAQDLGVDVGDLEEIVNHPDFERDVREEVARITVG